jgi:hypothetical protein
LETVSGKGHLHHPYLVEKINVITKLRMRMPAMVPTIVRISLNSEKEKERVETASN